MYQGELFDAPLVDAPPFDYAAYQSGIPRCGKCRHMDTSLPFCHAECGRCVNPKGQGYYLLPENTRINECYPEGDPDRYPDGGSWAYVASDSAGCAAFEKRPTKR